MVAVSNVRCANNMQHATCISQICPTVKTCSLKAQHTAWPEFSSLLNNTFWIWRNKFHLNIPLWNGISWTYYYSRHSTKALFVIGIQSKKNTELCLLVNSGRYVIDSWLSTKVHQNVVNKWGGKELRTWNPATLQQTTNSIYYMAHSQVSSAMLIKAVQRLLELPNTTLASLTQTKLVHWSGSVAFTSDSIMGQKIRSKRLKPA